MKIILPEWGMQIIVGLTPSQGGKYGGFGNPSFQSTSASSNYASGSSDVLSDPSVALSKAFSFLSSASAFAVEAVVKGAEIVNENVIKPTGEAIQRGEVGAHVEGVVRNVGGVLETVGRTVSETTSKAVRDISGLGNANGAGYGGYGAPRNGNGYQGNGGYNGTSSQQSYNSDDFFGQYSSSNSSQSPNSFNSNLNGNGSAVMSDNGTNGLSGSTGMTQSGSIPNVAQSFGSPNLTTRKKATKEDDEWDKW
ncbi:hypothetical protein BKA69DRAFT_684321 [Paraphysoderma sedebokerense]|nr:hypothetical protein BKA69DRAFT_684321 [Paraphysoderma sedebokerense]